MESKKINQLATELAPELSDLTIIGDPTTGISKKITLSQMASLFTGTVEEYANLASFPLVGTADTIYIALDTNIIYRWNTGTSAYVELSPNIVTSLVFNDANGFDGTISLVGSTATLTITTALTQGSVGFIGASGALTQDNSNFFWDNTNKRLGINTNAPTTAIDAFGSGIIGRLNGTSTNNAFLGFASAGSNKWSIGNVQSDHRFRIYSEANAAELVSVLQTGEVGIGIANPLTKLHIFGGASALIANLDANTSVAKSISFRSGNSSRINLEVSGTESGSNAGMDLFIRRYSDAGSLIDTALQITRSTGATTIKSATITGDFFANSNITSNKADSDSVYTGSSIFLSGTYIGIRGGVDHSFNIDTYNSGSVKNALKISQLGAATFVSSITNLGGMLLNVGATDNNGIAYTNFNNGVYSALNSATPSEGVGMWSDNQGNASIGALYNSTASSLSLVVRGSNSVNGKRALVINGSGNVAIGSTTPSGATLQLGDGSVNSYLKIRAADGGSVVFTKGSTDAAFVGETQSALGSGNGLILFTYSGGDRPIYFYTAGTYRAQFTNTGAFLLGRTTVFSIFGDSNGIVQYGDGTIYCAASNTEALGLSRIGTDGSVAIFRRSTTTVGSISVTGSATAYNTSSDYRLKEDLKDFDGLNIMSKIKFYDFAWKTDNTRTTGVIAHELQEVVPYAVYGKKDSEEMQGVDYSKLVAIQGKAIQQLEARIKQLESK